MKIINLSLIANPISISVQNPSQSDYNRFIGLEHYDSGEPVITRFQGTELLTTSAKAFKANDILIARRNVYLKRAGIVCFDGITSGDSIILRLKEDTKKTMGYSREDLIRYIPFVLNSEHFWIYANKHADGMNSKRISKDTLLAYEFELPSIDEMRDISDKLWAAYRLKQAYKKLLVATDEMVKSQFIEMFGTVENNTHNFPIMTIGEFANCFAGATPSTSHPEYWENGRIRWMSSGEVHKGHVEDTDSRITELGYKSASTRMVPIHSIVIAIAGQGKTRGTVAITEVDLCTNQSLCAIVPDERVNYSYLYHNLQGRYLELRGLSGDVNGRGGLNLKIIQKIPVILPPIEKQQQFASIAQQADKSKFELKQCIENIDKVIKSLINR